VAVLLTGGNQLPVIPLFDVVGRTILPPLHTGDNGVNEGTAGVEFTETVIVVVVAHCPALGVNVYVVEVVLLIAGDHVPVMPSKDDVGNEKLPPVQIGATGLNVGTIGAVTAILNSAKGRQAGSAGVELRMA
jgi:hypothetical protein